MTGGSNRRDGRSTAIGYVRVSTRAQGESGLGIDAQRNAIARYCRDNGLELIGEYSDVESGRKNLRPGLRDALAHAKGSRSLLVIARLDRLSRSVVFIATLLEGGCDFVACDVPSANRLVLHLLAAVAEEEARATSVRTRLAMAAAKARGAVFGNPAGFPAGACYDGARVSRVSRRRRRDETVDRVKDRIRELRSQGFAYSTIALALNDDGLVTSHGHKWNEKEVWRAHRLAKMDARGVSY